MVADGLFRALSRAFLRLGGMVDVMRGRGRGSCPTATFVVWRGTGTGAAVLCCAWLAPGGCSDSGYGAEFPDDNLAPAIFKPHPAR
jgi:hypothetical protein